MKKLILLCLSIISTFSCSVNLDNPKSMFNDLIVKFENSQIENKKIDSELDDGMVIIIYDSDHQLSNDKLCNFSLYSTMGQTSFLCYKKANTKIWYIKQTAQIYNSPYDLEDLYQNENHYFLYSNGKAKYYNPETNKYENKKDLRDFIAVPKVDNIEYVLRIIEENSN